MDKIFLTLLNRKPTSQEIYLLKINDINAIKNYIKNTSEFKIFYDSNLNKIYNIFQQVLESESIDLNTPIFMKTFVNFNYNENKMRRFILETINHIKQEYRTFYGDYLGLDEEITVGEILQIINDNYSVKNYITTSEKYLLLCDKRIYELTN